MILTIVVSVIGGIIAGCSISLLFKSGVIKDNRDLDTTLMAITAMVLSFIVTIGLFVIHVIGKEEKSLLSPEIVMALIQLPGLFASYALGKKAGQAEQTTTK